MSTPLKILEKNCDFCGKPLERKRFINSGRLEDFNCFTKRKYCDKKCMAQAFLLDDSLLTADASRKRARKYRKDFCSKCANTEGEMHIHHIDHNCFNNNPENLETLCEKCHLTYHSDKKPKKIKDPNLKCLICNDTYGMKKNLCNKHYIRQRLYGDALLKKVKQGNEFIFIKEI